MKIYLDMCYFNRPCDAQSQFDYTKWQREYFDAKIPETISEEASQFEKSHPFTSDVIRL